jgi:hypothetical protein
MLRAVDTAVDTSCSCCCKVCKSELHASLDNRKLVIALTLKWRGPPCPEGVLREGGTGGETLELDYYATSATVLTEKVMKKRENKDMCPQSNSLRFSCHNLSMTSKLFFGTLQKMHCPSQVIPGPTRRENLVE